MDGIDSAAQQNCICDGVTLTRRQWLVVRSFLRLSDGAIADAYNRLRLVRPYGDIPCSTEEFDDLVAKLDRGDADKHGSSVYWCPAHEKTIR